MADKKISALTAATTPLAGTEVLPIVQSGSTVKVANNDLRPKQIQSNATSGVLQVTGPAAAATRVMTTPDANFTVARTDAAQTFTGAQTFSDGVISNKSVVVGSGGTYSAGVLYSDASWGMIFRAANASPSLAEFRWANSADTELARIDTNKNFQIESGSFVVKTSGQGIYFTGNNSVFWRCGDGTPEGAVTAPVGSLYTRTDGGANTTLYVKESGAGNTGWVAK